jgi:hypothetical protein
MPADGQNIMAVDIGVQCLCEFRAENGRRRNFTTAVRVATVAGIRLALVGSNQVDTATMTVAD